MRESPSRKDLGSYYTPPEVVRTLVSWATEQDRTATAPYSILRAVTGVSSRV